MRLGKFLLMAALALSVIAPSAQAASINEQRLAFADWKGTHFDRNNWEWFGAFVYENASVTGESQRFGGVFKGRCVREKKRNGVEVSCHGRGRGMSGKDTFTMNPPASSAVLDVHDRNFHHHVEWLAKDDELPGMFQSESGCPAGSGYGAGIVRSAKSTADIFDRHFESKGGFSWNMLWTGAEVTQCSAFPKRAIADLLDGGGFALHLVRTIPSATARLAI